LPYKRYQARGITFVFKYDDTDPSLLHIYARHLTSPADAIRTFYEGSSTWNEDRGRFETYSATHGLFWFWIEEEKVAMIITCFTLA
jgi:hypothetical protein